MEGKEVSIKHFGCALFEHLWVTIQRVFIECPLSYILPTITQGGRFPVPRWTGRWRNGGSDRRRGVPKAPGPPDGGSPVLKTGSEYPSLHHLPLPPLAEFQLLLIH